MRMTPAGSSPYTKAYAEGYRWLRFPEPLESEYRSASASTMRQRLARASLAGAVAVVAWLLLDRFTTRYFQFPLAWIVLGGCMTLLFLLLILPNPGGRKTTPVSGWLLLVIDVLLGLSLIWLDLVMEWRHLPGDSYLYIALLVLLAGIYSNGLMTWWTALAGAALLLAWGLGQGLLAPREGAFLLPQSLYFLLLTVALGTFASWRLEYADREYFLVMHMLADMAEHDSLTGLVNHAAFIRHGERAWQQAARERKPVGLIIADIDHFKAFNDRYGHPAGDGCITRVAAVMDEAARRSLDEAGRLGGEEFAVFWYDMAPPEVARRAEALRVAVRELEIPHDGSSTPTRVTISIGVLAADPREVRDFGVALGLADKALYKAKNGGRDRVVAAEDR